MAAAGDGAGDDATTHEVTPAVAIGDDDLLVQLVEACLFMAGKAVTERDIAGELGIPGEAIHGALRRLSRNYDMFNGAMRVRNTHDDEWIMDLHEVVADHVESFYIEEQAFTRPEIMTLAYVAYVQPVPRKALAFYRGNNGPAHAARWIDAGFMAVEHVPRDDPALQEFVKQHEADKAGREASRDADRADKGGREASAGLAGAASTTGTAGTGRARKGTRVVDASGPIECLVTTPKFAGHFNLPRDVTGLKEALGTWREIYGILG